MRDKEKGKVLHFGQSSSVHKYSYVSITPQKRIWSWSQGKPDQCCRAVEKKTNVLREINTAFHEALLIKPLNIEANLGYCVFRRKGRKRNATGMSRDLENKPRKDIGGTKSKKD